MNQDEFETLLASLASQYAEACQEEIEALSTETAIQREVANDETSILYNAHEAGAISGSNKETRELQADKLLVRAVEHQQLMTHRDTAVQLRKRSTMFRVGIENEIKLWRAWLVASQGRND